MFSVYFLLAVVYISAVYAEELGPCDFDGYRYQAGETIMIAKCLATMVCLGNNNYGNMQSLGGVCPKSRAIDGQTGCWFDGKVYGPGDKIIIQPCLAEMTCNGYNSYSQPKPLGTLA